MCSRIAPCLRTANRRRQQGADFDATVAQVRDAMNAVRADNMGLANALLMETTFRLGFSGVREILRYIQRKKVKFMEAHPMLSYSGVIASEQLTFGDANVKYAYSIGPVMFPPDFMVGLCSFRETITLSAGFCNAGTMAPVVEGFLDLMEDQLLHVG